MSTSNSCYAHNSFIMILILSVEVHSRVEQQFKYAMLHDHHNNATIAIILEYCTTVTGEWSIEIIIQHVC